MTSKSYWVCRFCPTEIPWEHDDIVPKLWTFTKEHGLICPRCSKERKIKPEDTSWEEL